MKRKRSKREEVIRNEKREREKEKKKKKKRLCDQRLFFLYKERLAKEGVEKKVF